MALAGGGMVAAVPQEMYGPRLEADVVLVVVVGFTVGLVVVVVGATVVTGPPLVGGLAVVWLWHRFWLVP